VANRVNGKLLAAVPLFLRQDNARADPSRVGDGCREVARLLGEAIGVSRTLTGELSPPILQTGGLVAGLEWLVRWKAEKYQLAVELQADPRVAPDSEAMKLLLFQPVRELSFNVVKHAQVKAARVKVCRQGGHLEIVVSDQGGAGSVSRWERHWSCAGRRRGPKRARCAG
jgi:signal transduction histidine kinase